MLISVERTERRITNAWKMLREKCVFKALMYQDLRVELYGISVAYEGDGIERLYSHLILNSVIFNRTKSNGMLKYRCQESTNDF